MCCHATENSPGVFNLYLFFLMLIFVLKFFLMLIFMLKFFDAYSRFFFSDPPV